MCLLLNFVIIDLEKEKIIMYKRATLIFIAKIFWYYLIHLYPIVIFLPKQTLFFKKVLCNAKIITIANDDDWKIIK